MDGAEVDLFIILGFAAIYILISDLIVSRQQFYRRYIELSNEYWKEYFDFLKNGLKMTPEQIEEKRRRFNYLLLEQLKTMFIMISVYGLLFGSMVALIQILVVEPPKEYPYGDICIVDDKYIYEKGLYKNPDLINEVIIQDPKGNRFVCPSAVLYLPFQILNLRYVVGEVKIFIFFIIVLSILYSFIKRVFKL
ncbi:MAG: hypothetical protein NZ908_00765 [Candidatus Micrarchaeota archaeon]|nr:hypothetical protein [Candidatus Micrarchaeota archaeon]MCX8154677.1 hypothetical protein [Candidatus Micrarchaeota archaeon]